MQAGCDNDLSRQLSGRRFLITGSKQGLGETTTSLWKDPG